MSNTRAIAYDATFMIVYIGLSAAMVALSVTLLALMAFDIELGPTHVVAAVVNVLGWSVLPFAPRIYRQIVGQQFRWQLNGVLGGEPG